MPKIKEYFSNLGDRVKTSVRIKKEVPFFYLTLVLIVIIAILVRLSPVITGQILIKEFDPWCQLNSVEYILKNGLYDWLNYHDYKMWYPEGYQRSVLRPGLLFTAAFGYLLVTGIGFDITVFEFAFYFPAFMGGIAVIAMYYLGKEVLDRRTGLLAAFFLALSPGHMQRTVAGFFDNETVGVLSIILVFLFYIKAVKTGKIYYGVLAGLAMGYLSLSWGGLSYPFLLIPLLTAVLILLNQYSTRLILAYSTTSGLGLLLYTLNPDFNWDGIFSEMDFMVPFLFFFAVIAYHFLYMQKESQYFDKIISFIKWSAIPIALALGIIFFVKPEWIPFGLSNRLTSILNPTIRETINLVASVGEHMPTPWGAFYYNILIPLLLVIPGFYFALRRGEEQDILMIIIVLTLFYFTGSMIRVILVLSPAIALIGAYGLDNILKYFGNLMKKEQMFTRRRQRQIKRSVGISEALVVYSFIGILLFTQANHAIKITTQQFIYSELVVGGTFHDWEESLTWMKYNLPGTTVVVSWWDYGYWIRMIGNATAVNDNGTLNSTRIGLTGMAMMQTNERYSAEIFRKLKADYVLVYFGHLYTALGGDEGKWPWMLRICNDKTEIYQKWGLEKDNWYGAVNGENKTTDKVFDEDQYINETSGLYRQRWFDSTLVKLMFANEATVASNAGTELEYWYATEIEGSTDYNKEARKSDDGRLWSQIIPANGQYDFTFFEPTYYSTNKLVKIFKVDYTPLDTSFEVTNTYLDVTGKGYALVTNTGTLPLDIESLTINKVPFDLSLQKASSLEPDESEYVWFDTKSGNQTLAWTTNQAYNVNITAGAEREDGSMYTYSNQSQTTQINDEIVESTVSIDRLNSHFAVIGDVSSGDAVVYGNVTVQNTGSRLTKIMNFTINNEPVTIPNFVNQENQTYLIAPGDSQTFEMLTGIEISPDLSNEAVVSVTTAEKGQDETTLAYSRLEQKITILPENYEILPEQEYLYDWDTYTVQSPSISRFYMPYNDQTVLWENGTLKITVKNIGNDTLTIMGLMVNGKPINNFTIADDAYWPAPGESRVIYTQISEVERNQPIRVIVLADAGDNATYIAADSVYLVPRNSSAMITIIDTENSWTTGYTNETVQLVVKNTGSLSLNLTNVMVNGTDYSISSTNVTKGSITLNPDDVSVIKARFSNIKVNMTNFINIRVKTNFTAAFDDVELEARLPTKKIDTLKIHPDGAQPPPALFTTNITYGTTSLIHLLTILDSSVNITLDAVYIGENTSAFQLIGLNHVNLLSRYGEYNSLTLDCTKPVQGNYPIYILEINSDDIPISLSVGQTVYIKLVTVEGYEATVEIKIGSG